MICSASSSLVTLSYLALTPDFVINEYLSPGAVRGKVGAVALVEAVVPWVSAQRPLQQNSGLTQLHFEERWMERLQE